MSNIVKEDLDIDTLLHDHQPRSAFHPYLERQAECTAVTSINKLYHDILSVDSAPVTLLGTLVSVSYVTQDIGES